MNLYVFENIQQVTNRVHDSAGVIVIASDIERASALLPYVGINRDERDAEIEFDQVQSYQLAEPQDESVTVFPDAGCC